VIDRAGSIYASSEALQLSSRLSIASGASVVGEDTSAIVTGQCCTTVGGGGGLEEVHFGRRVIVHDVALGTLFFYIFW